MAIDFNIQVDVNGICFYRLLVVKDLLLLTRVSFFNYSKNLSAGSAMKTSFSSIVTG